MSEMKSSSIENVANKESELVKAAENANKLDTNELNAPIENVDIDKLEIPEMNSLDCRSECKYVTKGDSSKYRNFGYSG